MFGRSTVGETRNGVVTGYAGKKKVNIGINCMRKAYMGKHL